MRLGFAQTSYFAFPGPSGAAPDLSSASALSHRFPIPPACIILAQRPDYASAAACAPLDRFSFLHTMLFFFVCLFLFFAGIYQQSEV